MAIRWMNGTETWKGKGTRAGAAVVAALVAVALSVGIGLSADAQADKPQIHLGYVLWDSEIASTHVVAAVLQDRLGYNVRLTSVDAGPMWAGIASGDFDAIVAAWLPHTHAAYYERVKDCILDLGPDSECY